MTKSNKSANVGSKRYLFTFKRCIVGKVEDTLRVVECVDRERLATNKLPTAIL